MSTIAPSQAGLLHVDFTELYARHLCRHSQFGINVVHLAALFATWYAVYAALYWLTGAAWLPVLLAAAYLAVVALNAPARVCVATGLFLALFLGAVFWLPELPIWVYVVMVPLAYKAQAWSHKVFTAEADMSEFDKKYPKGPALFVLLLIYEIPLVLNYLVFDRKHWTA
jgi:hypothetical protein